jgi:hypothetical protein
VFQNGNAAIIPVPTRQGFNKSVCSSVSDPQVYIEPAHGDGDRLGEGTHKVAVTPFKAAPMTAQELAHFNAWARRDEVCGAFLVSAAPQHARGLCVSGGIHMTQIAIDFLCVLFGGLLITSFVFALFVPFIALYLALGN